MIANIRRLVIAHFALGLASVLVYWAGPGSLVPHARGPGRGIALVVLVKVFLAWIPYLLSGAYSCDVLPACDRKATFVFIALAVGVGSIAACLNLNFFAMQSTRALWLVPAGVTITLIAAARLCAAIWRADVYEWDSDL